MNYEPFTLGWFARASLTRGYVRYYSDALKTIVWPFLVINNNKNVTDVMEIHRFSYNHRWTTEKIGIQHVKQKKSAVPIE